MLKIFTKLKYFVTLVDIAIRFTHNEISMSAPNPMTKTDFDVARSLVFAPTVFNPDFNSFAPITANQAWSLFFTAGRDDAALDANPELGRLFNNILKAIVLTFVVGAFVFRSF